MPIYRRVAARGFSNYPFKTEYVVVNVSSLEKVFSDGDTVSLDTLVQKGLVKKSETRVKILGVGELKKKLDVAVPAISASAKEKIEKAGGKVVATGAASEQTEQ
jgi:large subunit ribosomal protein L15